MARWDITTRGSDYVVTYHCLGQRFDCGATPQAETQLQALLEWIAAEADAGDIACYGGALLFQKYHLHQE